ncbi:MAG: 2-amino-4-hydroxy-6-hydroxymethyldihydropteridine diphosphokinase [Planctomycetes bacterium]|nr:2-amino-4-hydroxy-6-hydroxymethyldihydropteridine diphosphokinase [Planctomycetota bacterium]
MSAELLHSDQPSRESPQACVSLGGNIGDTAETFRSALHRLDQHPQIELTSWSGLYESRPMGKEAGDVFRNAAAVIETTLEPLSLLDLLQSIEAEHDRSRDVRWGPRTLDLDLILFGGEVLSERRLKVPHPDCWYRRFVLEPVAEIAPDTRHPVLGESMQTLLDRLQAKSMNLGLIGIATLDDEWLKQASEEFSGVQIRKFESDGSSADLVIDFHLKQGQSTSPFHIPGFGFDPNQRILDILSAARGKVSRVAAIDLL